MATSIPIYEFSTNDKAGNPQWLPIASPCPPSPRNHISSIRLLTWNIWFDKLSQEQRFSAIIQQIVSLPHLNIAALQEVTPEFIQLAKAHPQIQREWLLTDYTDEEHGTEVEPTWYGNIFLVRKGWEGLRGWVRKFETSNMKRFVVILEIQNGSESLV
jgi:endonuclease/exonuclease/phosphatase family metal-dependent hydrolase